MAFMIDMAWTIVMSSGRTRVARHSIKRAVPVGWCPIPPYRIATHLAARVNHRAMERHVRTIVVSGSRGVGIWIRIALPLLRCG